MKKYIVTSIPVGDVKAENVPSLLDKAEIGFEPIANVNWAEAFPCKPNVAFRMAYASDKILLNYQVEEDSVRAVAPADNGRVWEDSCCEFFVSPADDGTYYNIECNCAGTLLVGFGPGREGRQHLPEDVLQKVDRWSSLGRQPFDASGRWLWSFPQVFLCTTPTSNCRATRCAPTSISVAIRRKSLISYRGIPLICPSPISIVHPSLVPFLSLANSLLAPRINQYAQYHTSLATRRKPKTGDKSTTRHSPCVGSAWLWKDTNTHRTCAFGSQKRCRLRRYAMSYLHKPCCTRYGRAHKGQHRRCCCSRSVCG